MFCVQVDKSPRVNSKHEESKSVDSDLLPDSGDGVTELVENPADEQGEEVVAGLAARQVDARHYGGQYLRGEERILH